MTIKTEIKKNGMLMDERPRSKYLICKISILGLKVSGVRSESSVLLKFLEKCHAAQAGLPFPVLPHYQEVVRWACDQTTFPEAHKHLVKRATGIVKSLQWRHVRSCLCSHERAPGPPPSVQSGHPSTPAFWGSGCRRLSLMGGHSAC